MPLVPIAGVPPPIDHVLCRIGFDELTVAARTELSTALVAVVKANAARYLRFFNESPAVSRRFHLLELLPGIGKKTMQQIVEERKRAPFQSFEEIEARLHLKNPERLIVGRIEQELGGVEDKYPTLRRPVNRPPHRGSPRFRTGRTTSVARSRPSGSLRRRRGASRSSPTRSSPTPRRR